MKYFGLCRAIADHVSSELTKVLRETGYVSTISDKNNLKSRHKVDEIANKVIREQLEPYNCNIFSESFKQDVKENADFAVFVDPVDGSLNWEKGIGDPCLSIAITPYVYNPTFGDLTFAYVEGLRSGDFYWVEDGKSFYFSKLEQKTHDLTCDGPRTLSEATAYLRPGYSRAKNQLIGSFPIFLLVKDIRAIDNAGTEICEIARGAADLMVEAGKKSDFYNLLAYPILRDAGGFVCDLDGNPIDDVVIDVEGQYDFIACNNKKLLEETLVVLGEFKRTKKYEREGIKFSFS